jgi:hypothetical protein
MSNTLSINNWDVKAVKYMTPKVNDKGGKSINIISTQTNRTLNVTSPLMMSWGIADFVDEKGESDGKFSISLNFPGEEYTTGGTNLFLEKLKKFEENFIDDAVKNSEEWFGEKMSREIVKHMYFPILKYSKNKDTKKIDYSKPPSIRAKVTNYGGKWNVEIFDIKMKMVFPDSTNSDLSPIEFVPKLSQVACMLSISNVWIGGKGCGITLKLTQCIVKPKESISLVGKCQIELSSEDMDSVCVEEEIVVEKDQKSHDTQVEDSDDEIETLVVKIEEVKIEEVKIEEVKIEEVKIEEVKIEEVKIEEVKIEEVKIEEVKPVVPVIVKKKAVIIKKKVVV